MKLQNYEVKNEKIKKAFLLLKKNNPGKFKKKLNLSWSNWGFGLESLTESAKRLRRHSVPFIELHGNHYGEDLGYKAEETQKILKDNNIKVSGICGMFSADNDLSSNRPLLRQNAVEYLKRELDFAVKVEAKYILVVPGAVGRPAKYDDSEFERSVETLRIVAGLFQKSKVRAAIEPIRAAEVSFIHTIADAKSYIESVAHPGVRHINGDVYHMQSGETHIGEALLAAGEMLTNLHMADSNRCALSDGALDLDTIIRALYLIGFNNDSCFVTPEPLGPGGDPYPAMNGKPDLKTLEMLVKKTAEYFKEREAELLR